MKKSIFTLFSALLILSCSTNSTSDKNPTLGTIGDKAMVVTAHPIASNIGKGILAKGDNVVDVAVTVHFTLAVVFPSAGNLRGGGFMVYRANDGTSNTLDFKEKDTSRS